MRWTVSTECRLKKVAALLRGIMRVGMGYGSGPSIGRRFPIDLRSAWRKLGRLADQIIKTVIPIQLGKFHAGLERRLSQSPTAGEPEMFRATDAWCGKHLLLRLGVPTPPPAEGRESGSSRTHFARGGNHSGKEVAQVCNSRARPVGLPFGIVGC